MVTISSAELFDAVVNFPDPDAQRRFSRLVGVGAFAERLVREATVMLVPASLERWSATHHGRSLPLLNALRDRPPLFVFAGDVGTGKTVLAETFGDAVARLEKIDVQLYRLSLKARGAGAVGEMTRLVSAAFEEVLRVAEAAKVANERLPRNAVILLIDEADALAQSRELAQMHHEDRAGVNAVIRGIDELAGRQLPALVVMCTNRPDAIDPAVQRRAAAVFQFSRPNDAQRAQMISTLFEGIGFTTRQVEQIVEATGASADRPYGHTYSDLVHRLVPAAIFDAFPTRPICFDRLLAIARELPPTPPFAGAP